MMLMFIQNDTNVANHGKCNFLCEHLLRPCGGCLSYFFQDPNKWTYVVSYFNFNTSNSIFLTLVNNVNFKLSMMCNHYTFADTHIIIWSSRTIAIPSSFFCVLLINRYFAIVKSRNDKYRYWIVTFSK